jgi:steroid 5-alpha reductase family enzyme
MTFLGSFALVALVILVYMTLIWIASLLLRDSSIVDIFWGAGFVLAAWTSFALTPEGFLPRKLLLAILVTLWGLRLSIYILYRNWGKGEDFRYVKWREENGKRWWWYSYFKVFLLQGALMWIISAPLLAAQISPTPNRLIWLDWLALVVWVIGFAFEAGGDLQLARFKAKPENKGKVMQSGFWRYTRHPNYFGDATQWWAYYLIALAAGGFWTIFSPIIMTGLLLRVSGVSLLESTLKETKPGYREYIETTSAFFPLPPRRKPQQR